LNKNYFYNIPNAEIDTHPVRRFVLFSESCINCQTPRGLTECINGANRQMCDLWNSDQLNLEFAISSYYQSDCYFQPSILPSSRFRIFKTNDVYSNTAMMSNDTLFVQIYDEAIHYGNFEKSPVCTVEIVFPQTEYMNIQEWVNLVNATFRQTAIHLDQYTYLSDILVMDWSFFPYQVAYETNQVLYIKSAIIMTQNKSPFTVRLLARMMLIQFFGKPMIAQQLPPVYDPKYQELYVPCDEKAIYGILNTQIQIFFPSYATKDPNVQLPIACMRRNAELIVDASSRYIGVYDGYYNDNLNSFSVTLNSTETWSYSNLDTADAHCVHFHLTSGFVVANDNKKSLIDKKSYNYFYSRDVYQIGAQQTIRFQLVFKKYPSSFASPSPPYTNIGGVIHCHFFNHQDQNGMFVQFYVDERHSSNT
jgi:hypothetical protein